MYEKEDHILKWALQLQQGSETDSGQVVHKEDFAKLLAAYEILLNDVKFLTRVSDRLQNKLNMANEDLKTQASSLASAQSMIVRQNEELQKSKENLEEKVTQRTSALREANDELVMAYKALDHFVYRASHDLKGPIASILGLCQVAKMDLYESPALYYIHMLEDTGRRMHDVLTRLVAVNVLKDRDLKPHTFLLSESVNRGLAICGKMDGFEQLQTIIRLPEALLIHTDASVLDLLLENLFAYIFKNIETQEESPYLRLSALSENDNLQLLLAYNGRKIPEGIADYIFEMFHRTSNHPSHTGMELYSARIASDKLGGVIKLLDSTNEETVFAVFLPHIVVKTDQMSYA